MDELKEKEQTAPVAVSPSPADLQAGYETALKVVDDVVLKNYISDLSHMEIIPLDPQELGSNNVHLFKITEMVYEKDELAVHKFATVFNALADTDSALFLILDSDGEKTDFYMGVRNLDVDGKVTTSSLRNTVESALQGQFPGIKIAACMDVQEKKLTEAISQKAGNISAVSCVANSKSHEFGPNPSFVQGLEKLALSMKGEKYTGIILANVTSSAQLKELRKSYEDIYTQLSPFASVQINYGKNESVNHSKAEGENSSHTDSQGIQYSETNSENHTSGTAVTDGTSKKGMGSRILSAVGAAASFAGAMLAPVTGGVSLFLGAAVSGGFGMAASAVEKTKSHSEAVNESNSIGVSRTKGGNEGTSDTVGNSTTVTEGSAHGSSQAMTFTPHNKAVENMLARIDKQLKRIDEFESLGMYECAAYFLSEKLETAQAAASIYRSLVRGENSGVEVAAVNSWQKGDETGKLSAYITNFLHPVFNYNASGQKLEVTPCSLVSSNELAIHMGLPRHSVSGFPVVEHTSFGKEVVTYDSGMENSDKIQLGKAFDMGREGKGTISLDANSLTMHTFVTGSTGSGKSNTVYQLLDRLPKGVNFLVIEPAKGEYKNVFGEREDVFVYGTNPELTKLLRINPFRFPEGILISEHLDRLVEIFNACWPMYAAMPAVLKDAIERAYVNAGWDLRHSKNKYGVRIFPNFADVLQQIDEVMEQSQYSSDSKGDYKGALCTRIRSLTTGINGLIFTADEIEDSDLFNRKVIVDLSRAAVETKALIMGLLVMKLQEYRMTTCKGMNAGLRHVTVLEEAHNLLKRTSTEQLSESANLMGKSVEMITNAIAEMRTYGEGFFIVDQAPGLLDMAVIRNTNTKIIMRLPDYSDRKLVGQAAGLKEEQIAELSKLKKGVAAVYQNDWVEPVLCSVGKWEKGITPYQPKQDDLPDETAIKKRLVRLAVSSPDKLERKDREKIVKEPLPTGLKVKLLDFFKAAEKEDADRLDNLRADILYEIFKPDAVLEENIRFRKDIREWCKVMRKALVPNLEGFSADEIQAILTILVYEKGRMDDNREYADLVNDLVALENRERRWM